MSLELEVFTKFQMQFMTLTAGSQSRVFKSMPKIFADNVHVCSKHCFKFTWRIGFFYCKTPVLN